MASMDSVTGSLLTWTEEAGGVRGGEGGRDTELLPAPRSGLTLVDSKGARRDWDRVRGPEDVTGRTGVGAGAGAVAGAGEGEGAGVLTLGGAALALGLGVIAGVDLNEAENFLAVMTPDPFLMCCFMY